MSHNAYALGHEEAKLSRALFKSVGVLCVIFIAGAFAIVNWFSALSVSMGVLLAVANFAYMGRTLKRYLLSGKKEGVLARVLIKYYIRFAITSIILWILISQGWAEPLGLLVGLSVVVTSLTVWGIIQARRLWG